MTHEQAMDRAQKYVEFTLEPEPRIHIGLDDASIFVGRGDDKVKFVQAALASIIRDAVAPYEEEVRRLRDALERIEGGYFHTDDDDIEEQVIEAQQIARAALRKEPTP